MTRKRASSRPYNIRKSGDRFGTVTLLEKSGPGRWLCRCDCGRLMTIQSGSLPGTRSCGRGRCNSAWTDTPTYATAHVRVKRSRGPARNQMCARCEKRAATMWAYDHQDPNELLDPVIGSPYSGDPSHYGALCAPCHRDADNRERRELRARIRELESELRRDNIRPACGTCNSETGGGTRRKGKP